MHGEAALIQIKEPEKFFLRRKPELQPCPLFRRWLACAVMSPLMVCLAVNSNGGAQRASTTAALLLPRFQASPDGLSPLGLAR